MARGRERRPPAKFTKKQLSRRRREQRQLRWVWIGVGAVAALVIAILAIGLISQGTQAVAVVNGDTIRVGQYQQRVRFWYHYYNSYLIPGSFDNLEQQQRQQFYQDIADQLIEETLVRQEAEKRDLSVAEQEVQVEIEEAWFQHFRTPPVPTPSPTPDPEATPTAAGTPLPTPTPDTEEAFQARYKEFVSQVLQPAGWNEGDFRRFVEASLLEEKLQQAIVLEVPAQEEQVRFRYLSVDSEQGARDKIAAFQAGVEDQVHAQHILVETQEEAQAVLERLEAGEDFAALAAELSTDESNKDQGGDLGWFGRGQMVAPFENVAFEAELGLYPEPVETSFGYHVIKILERENRPIDPEEEMFDAGWYGRPQLEEQFGPLFAEILYSADAGLIPDPVPTQFGVAVVELLDRQVRQLDEQEQEQRRTQLFGDWLDGVRQEGSIENNWDPSMVPSKL